jgi:hypothetical protein
MSPLPSSINHIGATTLELGILVPIQGSKATVSQPSSSPSVFFTSKTFFPALVQT